MFDFRPLEERPVFPSQSRPASSIHRASLCRPSFRLGILLGYELYLHICLADVKLILGPLKLDPDEARRSKPSILSLTTKLAALVSTTKPIR